MLPPTRPIRPQPAAQRPSNRAAQPEHDRVMLRKLIVAGMVSSAVVAYVRWLRPKQMHWGASEWDTERPLPGDELVVSPHWNATRAVTIAAKPSEIWPWLLQIGWGRAGWYGYDWADNGFKPSSWEILPEYQDLAIGKKFPMSPVTAMVCAAFEEGRWMLWRNSPEAGTWLWYLEPLDEDHTRLITRMRDRYHWLKPWFLLPQLAVDVIDFPFMRKCMLGIKARAEKTHLANEARRDAAALPGGRD